MIPKKIKVESGALVILWSGGMENSIKLTNLRYNCPCALCAEQKEKEGNSYIPIYNEKEISIADMKTIGSYALGITCRDGHNTGIYNYELLYTLASDGKN